MNLNEPCVKRHCISLPLKGPFKKKRYLIIFGTFIYSFTLLLLKNLFRLLSTKLHYLTNSTIYILTNNNTILLPTKYF